jgi:hypothetical protein
MRIKERFVTATVGNLKGTSNMAGISVMGSGTTVASVAATGVRSGSVIQLTPYMAVNASVASGSGVSFIGLNVSSVRAGAFEITAIGSRAPVGDMPVAWNVINR